MQPDSRTSTLGTSGGACWTRVPTGTGGPLPGAPLTAERPRPQPPGKTTPLHSMAPSNRAYQSEGRGFESLRTHIAKQCSIGDHIRLPW
jgi:hypothetical protein